mgnify:CR=1 FL=1
MPKYHFDKIVNRRKVNSYKWDVGEDELPMWVADMDFDTAPEIKNALQKRIEQATILCQILSLKPIFLGGKTVMNSHFKKIG